VNLELTEEQSQLANTFSRLFSNESTSERIRAAELSGYDQGLWNQLVELGAPGIRVAEEHGGAGMSLRNIILICEQAGHYIAPVPLVECAAAAKLLSDLGSTIAIEWLDKILEGSAIVSLAMRPVAYAANQVVSSGAIADAVIALDGESVVLLRADGSRTEIPHNLGSMPISNWPLKSDAEIVLATGQEAVDAYNAVREEWKFLAAAQMKGMCDRALSYAAEYCNEREAFGVKIGTFQGLSHPLAECASAVAGIDMLLQYSLWKLEQNHDDAAAFPAMAYWWATETTCQTMPWCIQVFGGLGVCEEHDIQLYARRGIALTSLLGDRQQEAADIASRYWGGKACVLPATGETAIDFNLGATAQAMRERTQQVFNKLLTSKYDDYRKHSWDGYHPDLYQALAEENLLFPEWPEKYGGLGANRAELSAIADTFFENRVTIYPQGTTRVSAEMILKFGSEKLKDEALPSIANGTAIVCFGLTEPSGGSDVFAAKTKAVKQGDKWIINGQKMYTSGANVAKYVLLLTNTDPSLPKHVGKTMFLVPMDLPGIKVHRVNTISGDRTNMTYYADVEVSDEYRLGEVNNAAHVLGYMLALEQSGGSMGKELIDMTNQAAQWALSTSQNGQLAFDNPLTRARLGSALTHYYVGEALALRLVHDEMKGIDIRHHGSICKSFTSEASKKCGVELLNMVGPDALFSATDKPDTIESGWRASLAACIYAGTTQVHRSIIAEKGLGLPRSRPAG